MLLAFWDEAGSSNHAGQWQLSKQVVRGRCMTIVGPALAQEVEEEKQAKQGQVEQEQRENLNK